MGWEAVLLCRVSKEKEKHYLQAGALLLPYNTHFEISLPFRTGKRQTRRRLAA
jgi:hypothetical protein